MSGTDRRAKAKAYRLYKVHEVHDAPGRWVCSVIENDNGYLLMDENGKAPWEGRPPLDDMVLRTLAGAILRDLLGNTVRDWLAVAFREAGLLKEAPNGWVASELSILQWLDSYGSERSLWFRNQDAHVG